MAARYAPSVLRFDPRPRVRGDRVTVQQAIAEGLVSIRAPA